LLEATPSQRTNFRVAISVRSFQRRTKSITALLLAKPAKKGTNVEFVLDVGEGRTGVGRIPVQCAPGRTIMAITSPAPTGIDQ
jgi:hypothetical protein